MRPLTDRQRETLAWITGYMQTNWRAPTAEEIAGQFEISRSSAFDMIKALQKKGYLERGDGTPRSLKPRNLADATLACVEGRLTELAPYSASISEVRGFDGLLRVTSVHGGSKPLFLAVVRGDGMIEAGISDGDLAVLRRQDTAEDGDIMLASFGNEVTLQRVAFGDDGTVLFTPENRRLTAFAVPVDEVTFHGKLVALYRDMD